MLHCRSNVTHGREIQMFCCFVDLDKTQVEEYYKQGPEDQYESVGINFMTLDRIVDIMVRGCYDLRFIEHYTRQICS